MTVPYLGPEWGREAVRRLRDDAHLKEALEGIDVRVAIRVPDAPEGRYRWLYAHFRDGLAEALMGEDEAELGRMPAPAFTVEGPYATFAAIQRGMTTEAMALLSGQLHVKGNRLAALRHLKPMQAVLETLAAIPCKA